MQGINFASCLCLSFPCVFIFAEMRERRITFLRFTGQLIAAEKRNAVVAIYPGRKKNCRMQRGIRRVQVCGNFANT